MCFAAINAVRPTLLRPKTTILPDLQVGYSDANACGVVLSFLRAHTETCHSIAYLRTLTFEVWLRKTCPLLKTGAAETAVACATAPLHCAAAVKNGCLKLTLQRIWVFASQKRTVTGETIIAHTR